MSVDFDMKNSLTKLPNVFCEFNRDTIDYQDDEEVEQNPAYISEFFDSDDEVTHLKYEDRQKLFERLDKNFGFYKKKVGKDGKPRILIKNKSQHNDNPVYITNITKLSENKFKINKSTPSNVENIKKIPKPASMFNIKILIDKKITINSLQTLPKIK